jgi:CheY-like chemotaxis protein
MTHILLIEDDQDKREQLLAFLESSFPGVRIDVSKSFRSGVDEAIKGGWTLIILDMTMPTFDLTGDEDGGRPQVYAGLEILRQMRRLHVDTPVLVVTQFDQFGEGNETLTLSQVDRRLRSTHPTSYKGSVYYNPVLSDWQRELRDHIGGILKDEIGR